MCIRDSGFVPHAGTLAVGRENRRHALHEEVFQSVRIGHAPPAHQRLTVGAAVPLGHVHLVAADVYVPVSYTHLPRRGNAVRPRGCPTAGNRAPAYTSAAGA